MGAILWKLVAGMLALLVPVTALAVPEGYRTPVCISYSDCVAKAKEMKGKGYEMTDADKLICESLYLQASKYAGEGRKRG